MRRSGSPHHTTAAKPERLGGWLRRPRRPGPGWRLLPRHLGSFHILRWVPALVALLPWLLGPINPSQNRYVVAASGPYQFSLLDWEAVHLAQRLPRLWQGLVGQESVQPRDVAAASAYLGAPPAGRARLRTSAEGALERLVSQAYRAAGVRPLLGGATPFRGLVPPVLIDLSPPPNVLVVSPRTRLEVVDTVMLDPELAVTQQEAIERSADSHGVSSLVTAIGGIATYPSIVPLEGTGREVLQTIAHEWLHQYLAFYPLGGPAYWSSQETREINETVADLVGREIGGLVADELGLPKPGPPAPSSFDFRAFMRATRLEVERLLAVGRVADAEAYMERRRLELQRHGYFLRKLNQAYFAFYGSYGDGFAASPASPVAALLRHLRGESPSVGAFLERVRSLTSIQELRAAAGR